MAVALTSPRLRACLSKTQRDALDVNGTWSLGRLSENAHDCCTMTAMEFHALCDAQHTRILCDAQSNVHTVIYTPPRKRSRVYTSEDASQYAFKFDHVARTQTPCAAFLKDIAARRRELFANPEVWALVQRANESLNDEQHLSLAAGGVDPSKLLRDNKQIPLPEHAPAAWYMQIQVGLCNPLPSQFVLYRFADGTWVNMAGEVLISHEPFVIFGKERRKPEAAAVLLHNTHALNLCNIVKHVERMRPNTHVCI
jgi:hypothetical protein